MSINYFHISLALFPIFFSCSILQIKMSGKSSNPVITWAGNGILATATGESIVR